MRDVVDRARPPADADVTSRPAHGAARPAQEASGHGRRFEFAVLGPLTVTYGGVPVPVNGARQRVLLASLLVDANRIVPVDELIARLGRPDPGGNARANLHTYIMRLRRALARDGEPVPIVTRTEGYLIEVPGDALDLYRFDALVNAAKVAAPERASSLLVTALGLWSGAPLSDVPSEFLRREVVPGLAERRPLALELYIDAELSLGHHHDLLVRLRELTAQYPLRERFWTQQMIALYRCGRQAEALACFRTVAALLGEELGVEPSAEMQELHGAILARDPRLSAPVPRIEVQRNHLPSDVPDFVGRDAELARLVPARPAAGVTGVVAVDGMAGVGKTAFAVRAAHRIADRYPDAQLFLDLHGHRAGREPIAPVAALGVLLRAVGVAGERIPDRVDERAALWRAELIGRRVLIVLDDAADAAQVRPLLPGGSGCLVLVTSRRRLTDLDTSDTLSLDVLAPAEATALFARLAGEARATAEADAMGEVVEACGRLPLALRIAGGRLRGRSAWTVGHLARRLSERTPCLDEFTTGDRSVAAAFALSYDRLGPDLRHMFHLLGLLYETKVDVDQAAALADVGREQAERLLEDLVDVHLLEQPAAGHYRMHTLLGRFARARAHEALPEPYRGKAVRRVLARRAGPPPAEP